MARLRAIGSVASAIGSFNPGQVFEIDNEDVAAAWIAAGVVEAAPLPEPLREPAPSGDVQPSPDPDAPSVEDMQAAIDRIKELETMLEDERQAHAATKAALETATKAPEPPAPAPVETATAPATERATVETARTKPPRRVSGD